MSSSASAQKRARRYELFNETVAFRCVVHGCAREVLPRSGLQIDETGVSALTRAAEMFVDRVTEGAWALTHEFGGEGAARVRVSAAEADKSVVLGDAVKRYLFREMAWEEKLRQFAGTVINKHTVNMRQAFMFSYDADKEDPAALLDRWSGYQDTVVRVMPDAAREVLFKTCGAMPGASPAVVEAAAAASAVVPSFATSQQQQQQLMEQQQIQLQHQHSPPLAHHAPLHAAHHHHSHPPVSAAGQQQQQPPHQQHQHQQQIQLGGHVPATAWV